MTETFYILFGPVLPSHDLRRRRRDRHRLVGRDVSRSEMSGTDVHRNPARRKRVAPSGDGK